MAALVDWVVVRVQPLLDGAVTEAAMDDLLRTEVAPVIAAARDGVARVGTNSDGELLRNVTQPARRDLALLVAERDGLGPVEPGEYADTLSNAWPSGDPIEELEQAAIDQAESHTDDDDW